ncbi:hypothetical protein HID58_093058 [Brassica napus]|uniref:Uncharacterized protein n=1 Tax=Brassica napus TaxID=3708 RepID=A0ABQ7XCN0_BRANA|nr:hypothetical protein HID58_093058 [Brassica napus]
MEDDDGLFFIDRLKIGNDGLFFVFSSSSLGRLMEGRVCRLMEDQSHASRKEKLRFNNHKKNQVFFNKGRYLKETGHNMEHEWKRMILNWRLYRARLNSLYNFVPCLRDKVTTDGVFVQAEALN